MNTRLQVEHPITEKITGLDLVEQMIRAAAGQELSIKQEDVQLNGWAVESRVYAEDPLRNFLPSIGKLKQYTEPQSTDSIDIRVDSGILEGSDISMYYDPLISKLVTHGPNRIAAIDAMSYALDRYVIRGLNHNVNFLRSVMDNAVFRSGQYDTGFIESEYSDGFSGYNLSENNVTELLASTATIHMMRILRNNTISGRVRGAALPTSEDFVLGFNDKEFTVSIRKDPTGAFDVVVKSENGADQHAVVNTAWPVEHPVFEASINKKDVCAQLISSHSLGYQIQIYGTIYDLSVKTLRQHELSEHMPVPVVVDHSNSLLSPMPGKIVALLVKAGDKVVPGQRLAVVEAMKMQNILRAERDGVVKAVAVKAGDSVAVDEELLNFEKQESA
eukprot:TRINITY_DN314_c0_g1_i5.p1 TRINITY_DN314_c0_g1~~TRINITY_DN314_c0_g1_i5.p1  ORF type:complete len:430 (-),score=64.50 TRINITY_DN314_c0_g1_i5:138-1301(-)